MRAYRRVGGQRTPHSSTRTDTDIITRAYLPELVAVPGDHKLAHAPVGVSQQRRTEHFVLRRKLHVTAQGILPCLCMERITGARPLISARRPIGVGGVDDSG